LSTEPTFIDKISTSYASRNIQVAPKEAPGKQSASKRSASKKKEEAKVATVSPAELEIHFIDLSTSEEKQ
jgi:hypothetical protein